MFYTLCLFAGFGLGALGTWAVCAELYGKVIRAQQEQIDRLIPDFAGGRRAPSAGDLRAAYDRTYGSGGSVDASGLAHPRTPN